MVIGIDLSFENISSLSFTGIEVIFYVILLLPLQCLQFQLLPTFPLLNRISFSLFIPFIPFYNLHLERSIISWTLPLMFLQVFLPLIISLFLCEIVFNSISSDF